MNTASVGRVCRLLGAAARKIAVEPREALLRARMVYWVLVIAVLARLTSLPRAQRIASLGIGSRTTRRASFTPAQLGTAIDSVLAIDLFMFRRSCWKRALVLQRFLSLNGVESRVNFGVRKTVDGTVDGHAWLEHQGRPLLEGDTGTYVVTFTLPVEGGTGRERSAS